MCVCNNLVWDWSRLSFPERAARGDAPAAVAEPRPTGGFFLVLWCSLEIVVTVEQDLKDSGWCLL